MKPLLADHLPPWIFAFAVLVCWQLVVALHWVPAYLLPAPLDIARAIVDDWPSIWRALRSTFLSTIWGLGMSFVVGVALALALFSVDVLRRAILPFCIFFQTVPIIAIAPLLVIWFGFGQPTVRASAFIVALFPILANTLTGLQQTDPQLKELFMLYRPSRLKLIAKLQIPCALPYMLAGLRIAVGLTVVGAIVGEFIAGGGLGSLIDSARTQQRVDLVFAGVLMSSLLALALIFLIDGATRVLLGRRPFLRNP